jgi:hypothetical protein
MVTPHELKTSLVTSDFFFWRLLSSSVGQFSPWGRSGPTVWKSSPSTVELSRSSLLLCFGDSLPCERKRFYMRCLGIDVTRHAMHCFFSCIRCCGDMITEPLSSNGRLALPPLLMLSGVMSQYFLKFYQHKEFQDSAMKCISSQHYHDHDWKPKISP